MDFDRERPRASSALDLSAAVFCFTDVLVLLFRGSSESNFGIAISISFIIFLYFLSEMEACSTGRWPEMRVFVRSVAFGMIEVSKMKSMLIRSMI